MPWLPENLFYKAAERTVTQARSISGDIIQTGSSSLHSVQQQEVFNISTSQVHKSGLGVFCFSARAVLIPTVWKVLSINSAGADLSTSVILRINSFVNSRNKPSTLSQEVTELKEISSCKGRPGFTKLLTALGTSGASTWKFCWTCNLSPAKNKDLNLRVLLSFCTAESHWFRH